MIFAPDCFCRLPVDSIVSAASPRYSAFLEIDSGSVLKNAVPAGNASRFDPNRLPTQGAVHEGIVEETLILELRSSAEQAGNCPTTVV
jgi:hypothetical protein